MSLCDPYRWPISLCLECLDRPEKIGTNRISTMSAGLACSSAWPYLVRRHYSQLELLTGSMATFEPTIASNRWSNCTKLCECRICTQHPGRGRRSRRARLAGLPFSCYSMKRRLELKMKEKKSTPYESLARFGTEEEIQFYLQTCASVTFFVWISSGLSDGHQDSTYISIRPSGLGHSSVIFVESASGKIFDTGFGRTVWFTCCGFGLSTP